MRAVIKIGGSFADSPQELRALMQRIEELSGHHLLVIVPGGGPFADNVRKLQAALNVSDSSAHWMAILGMEQFGELLSQYAPMLVTFSGREVLEMVSKGRSFILQPYRLLRAQDELPHSWSVTSDSIAVWIGVQIDADLVVLAKSTDKFLEFYEHPRDSGDMPVSTEEIKTLAENGVVDVHVPKISPHFKGALHVIDGRNRGILDEILEKEDQVH
ncbi:MAG: hypothetical protein ACFFC0_09755 [Promethearchaeota archaeon]